MKVYFMRHGESEYNVKDLINFDPKVEVNLTEKGKMQVRESAEKLKDVRFDAIFSSELLRTQETAVIMNQGRDLKVRVDKRIDEISLGMEGERFEGYSKLREAAGEFVNFKIEGFESFIDVKARVLDFLEGLKKEKYGRTLVVAHEAVVQAARALFNQLSDSDSFATPIKHAEYFMFDM